MTCTARECKRPAKRDYTLCPEHLQALLDKHLRAIR